MVKKITLFYRKFFVEEIESYGGSMQYLSGEYRISGIELLSILKPLATAINEIVK